MKLKEAIIYTILYILIPISAIPVLQWYQNNYVAPYEDDYISGILYVLLCLGMLALIVRKWALYIADDLSQ